MVLDGSYVGKEDGWSLGGWIVRVMRDDEGRVGHCHWKRSASRLVGAETVRCGAVWCGVVRFGAVRCGAMRCSNGGQLKKLGQRQGASTGAAEWDLRGIGTSKDGNRDWGRNVV